MKHKINEMKNMQLCLATLICTAFWGCAPDLRSDFKFTCASQLTEGELARFATKVAPKYTFEELKLLGKISSLIFDANGRVKDYKVQFWHHTDKSLDIQVFGMADEAAIDKSTCAVLKFKDYLFPPETILLFYRTEKNAPQPEIVVGLRKK